MMITLSDFCGGMTDSSLLVKISGSVVVLDLQFMKQLEAQGLINENYIFEDQKSSDPYQCTTTSQSSSCDTTD